MVRNKQCKYIVVVHVENCAPVARAPHNFLPLVWPTTSEPEVHSELVKAERSFLLVTRDTRTLQKAKTTCNNEVCASFIVQMQYTTG